MREVSMLGWATIVDFHSERVDANVEFSLFEEKIIFWVNIHWNNVKMCPIRF